MRLELLPNEILIECFEYLNAFEIFDSFDQLNHRFSRLIRTIPLHLNFQHIRKTVFDRFCRTIQSNPELKTQIYTLKLSNKDTCGQMEIFLSFFSLNEFAQLRSLTLIQIEKNHLQKFQTTLPFMQQLHSFRLTYFFDRKNREDNLLTILPMTNLKVISIPTLQSILTNINQTSTLTHLSVSSCSLQQLLSPLFQYAPFLKYLHIENIYQTSQSLPDVDHHSALHLKQLIIRHFEYPLADFETLTSLTPNLKSLTISTLDNILMIDADHWEHLIKSSLPFLKIFHFIFGLYCRGKLRNDMINKFKQFQNHFWSEEHQWFTEYVFDSNSAVIYTVPYVLNTYRLKTSTEKYSNRLHTFDHVTDLTLCYEAMNEKCMPYFPHVTSVELTKQDKNQRLEIEYIQSLDKIMNFYYLKHLDISSCLFIETSALLEICKRASQLSSITIDPLILSRLYHNHQLCEYLNRMIKKLNLCKFAQNSFNEVTEFCEKFSNIEELICEINQSNQLLILLNQLTKLNLLTIILTSMENLEEFSIWFHNEALKFNMIYRMNYFHTPGELYKIELSIWIGGRMSD